MKLYVSTSDQYIHLMKPFMFLLEKFWKPLPETIVLGYTPPNFELPNATFVSLGDPDVKEWTTGLYNYFNSLESNDPIIYTLDDCFVVGPEQINTDIISKLVELVSNNADIGRINISNDLIGNNVKQSELEFPQSLIELTDDADWRISTSISIWNKDYLVKNLKPGWTPWQFEVEGSKQAKNDGFRIMGTNYPYLTYYSNGIDRHAGFNTLDFRFWKGGGKLSPDYIQEMLDKKIISEDLRILY